MKTIKKIKFKTAQIIALGFAGVIFIGTVLLWLPISSAKGVETSFMDALFTATTSVCVTGLVTVSSAANWSIFGKLIITLLIQLGGLGVITCTTVVLMVVGKRITIGNRKLIQESYNLDSMSGLAKLIIKIVKGTLTIEGIGAVLYAICFIPEFGLAKGTAVSIFNSISAFCNAGMDIIGENSLADYVTSPLVNFTTMGLIVLGGLGYVVWWDVVFVFQMYKKKKIPKNRIWQSLQLHSKVVFISTITLISAGTILILLFEYNNKATLGNLGPGHSVMAALFQSVTCRTAGFLTIPQDGLRDGTAIVCMVLMFIGGSPMGTAGGVKTTTIWVLALTAMSFLRGKKDTEVFARRISMDNIRAALVVAMVGISVIFVSVLSMTAVMQAPLIDILYEVTSAAGTVGLSRGLTTELNTVGKLIIIITMYIGRIGPVTLATALTIQARHKGVSVHLPEKKILIG